MSARSIRSHTRTVFAGMPLFAMCWPLPYHEHHHQPSTIFFNFSPSTARPPMKSDFDGKKIIFRISVRWKNMGGCEVAASNLLLVFDNALQRGRQEENVSHTTTPPKLMMWLSSNICLNISQNEKKKTKNHRFAHFLFH